MDWTSLHSVAADIDRARPPKRLWSSLFWREEMIAQDLVHGEHVHSILLEDGTEGVVASNLSLVFGILEVMLFEVGPQSLDRLRPRELRQIESTGVEP